VLFSESALINNFEPIKNIHETLFKGHVSGGLPDDMFEVSVTIDNCKSTDSHNF
jgi:hypothetical protein